MSENDGRSQYFSDAEEQTAFKKKRVFRLSSPDPKKDESERVYVYRVLPAILKQLALGKGVWRVYRGQHWGYKIPSFKEPENPDKAFSKTFLCIEDRDFQTKLVRRNCPECDSIAFNKKIRDVRYDAELKKLMEGGADEKTAKAGAKETVKAHDTWLRQHNCDRKWYIHVKTLAGEFGTLLISNDDKKLLDMKIKQLETETKIDHKKASQGVWWKFTVTGDHFERKVDITWLQENVEVNGETFQRVKKAPLTEEDGRKATEELDDLSDLVMALSKEQIELLVKCSGDAKAVAEIMGLSQKTEKESEPTTEPSKSFVALPTVIPAAASVTEDDEEAAALRAVEAIRAKKAAVKAAADLAAANKSTVAPTESAISALRKMPNEEFEARFAKKPETQQT